MLYQWMILQDGSLPLRPDDQMAAVPHVCTATLVWPADTAPSSSNSVLVDPCFSPIGQRTASSRLRAISSTLEDIGFYFETHRHGDHQLNISHFSSSAANPNWSTRRWQRWSPTGLEGSTARGIKLVSCPGHAECLHALRFDTRENGETWVVGDAILDRDWLVQWKYYWPNIYDHDEVVQTWQTVADILQTAATIIPGHGLPIKVDVALLDELITGFSRAEHHEHCADVGTRLEQRLTDLQS